MDTKITFNGGPLFTQLFAIKAELETISQYLLKDAPEEGKRHFQEK